MSATACRCARWTAHSRDCCTELRGCDDCPRIWVYALPLADHSQCDHARGYCTAHPDNRFRPHNH